MSHLFTVRRGCWRRQRSGGYGYIERVPCLVVGETQHSYVIEIETLTGGIVKRRIAKENFIPEVPA